MRTFKKEEVSALPVFIGQRTYDGSDIEELMSGFWMYRGFNSFHPQVVSYVGLKKRKGLIRKIGKLKGGLIRRIREAEEAVAVFLIMVWSVAQEKDIVQNLVNKIRKRCPADKTFIYQIVMDYGGAEMIFSRPKDLSLVQEGKALYSFFNHDARTAGSHRLIELMNRIMGADLPGDEFPNYPMADLQKMAKHINHENFNSFGRREGSIPKYPIGEDGRPLFPVIQIEVDCPCGCGGKKIVDRFDLDAEGNAKVRCYMGEGRQEHIIPGIGSQFDPWPQFDAMRQQTA
ncbi:MAG: hypothetical protein PHF35_00785 [Candidatus Moranbacteria bacterium]|nr:hypothetical protein [Candidatus Moranbacteria bacterium]